MSSELRTFYTHADILPVHYLVRKRYQEECHYFISFTKGAIHYTVPTIPIKLLYRLKKAKNVFMERFNILVEV